MKQMIYYNKPKYRNSIVNFKNNSIYVIHTNKVTNIKKINFETLIDETSNSNEYISRLLNVDNAYCTKYLKGVIKRLKNKSLDTNDFTYLEELFDNYYEGLSLYNETEIYSIFFKFSKNIWKIIEKNSENFLIYLQKFNYKESIKEFIKLLKVNKRKLQGYIENLTQSIGVPVKIKENKADWTMFTYNSVLSYLLVTIFEDNDFYNSSKINTNILYHSIYKELKKMNNIKFSEGHKIIRLKNDTKQVHKIKFLMPFIFCYLDNHYTSYVQYYEFHYADHMIDVLEDHRQYLITDAINKKQLEKIEKIKNYSYDELNNSYRRKLLKY